ncbi:hypothetical protein TanjilG_16826 [Lupinus angustifolius]|uniref:Uncharacterized protein n=1 Tax=Lupinus angustifolius TaxID=3871 RepID=A0A1J7FMW3_LUPAN|nr:hypothetical protein TanjilG_24344 [Lupinus angustifolius]OIW19176.1 hypothetical protein TanjilG_16826 [Lupinus angustifolius]
MKHMKRVRLEYEYYIEYDCRKGKRIERGKKTFPLSLPKKTRLREKENWEIYDNQQLKMKMKMEMKKRWGVEE